MVYFGVRWPVICANLAFKVASVNRADLRDSPVRCGMRLPSAATNFAEFRFDIDMDMCVHVCMYACMYTYIHTYIHLYINIQILI